jgi:hypothetical protein
MQREQIIAYVAVAAVVLIVGFTMLTRYHDGRCHPGGRRGGLDCTYPAPGTGSWRP